ncbi:glycosyltransferase [Candidatus Curtissbacteria bacterium]|nr:glycosyltransferase [Candidatus Curtissbacteria bacterium]
MKPLISVVIPAYNEEKYVGHTIQRLKEQDFEDDLYEVVIVDNNSSDKTAQVATKLGVKVVEYNKTQGVSGARQAGVEAAQGEIIAFTDADTLPPKNWLSGIARAMDDEKVIIVGGKILPYGAGAFVRFLFNLYDLVVFLNTNLGKPMFWGNNFATRRWAIEGIGGFNIKLSTSEDWDLTGRIKRKYGREYKIVYKSNLVAETSNRKQQNTGVFLRYIWQGTMSYINVVLLGRAKSGKIVSVR